MSEQGSLSNDGQRAGSAHPCSSAPPNPLADTALMRQGIFRRNVILAYLMTYQDGHGFPPNFREIGAAVGLHSTRAVQHQLDRLEREGFISRDHWKARSIRLLERAIA